MKNLFSLLERFTKVLDRGKLTKENIIKVVESQTRIILKEEDIHLKEGVLEINTSPVVKNEIRLKEEAIRSELKEAYNIKISFVRYH
ncbi:hypothetical protein KW807_01150 [Candidatus Parcubacteria bacterium]|nr:hypothetical protein [Candidatus Parcubacteria bacterium]